MSVGYVLGNSLCVEASAEFVAIARIFYVRSLQPESKYPNHRYRMA